MKRFAVVLLGLGLLLALWPVRADRTRYEMEMMGGPQPRVQLLTPPAEQRPFLRQRPLCGPPIAAPLTYMRDTALRSGCAGPNGRSMALAAMALLAALVVGATGVRGAATGNTVGAGSGRSRLGEGPGSNRRMRDP